MKQWNSWIFGCIDCKDCIDIQTARTVFFSFFFNLPLVDDSIVDSIIDDMTICVVWETRDEFNFFFKFFDETVEFLNFELNV